MPPVHNNWYFIQYIFRGIFSKEHIMNAQHTTAAGGIARAIRQLTVGYVRKRHENRKTREMKYLRIMIIRWYAI